LEWKAKEEADALAAEKADPKKKGKQAPPKKEDKKAAEIVTPS